MDHSTYVRTHTGTVHVFNRYISFPEALAAAGPPSGGSCGRESSHLQRSQAHGA